MWSYVILSVVDSLSPVREKEQAGPQPELVKIELSWLGSQSSLLGRCGPLRPIKTLVIRLYKRMR
jgi:hypothetical protein